MHESDLMEALAKAEKREYARKWRSQNKDRVKAINDRYWKKRAAKRAAETEQEVK